jgi:hypothetical protein
MVFKWSSSGLLVVCPFRDTRKPLEDYKKTTRKKLRINEQD